MGSTDISTMTNSQLMTLLKLSPTMSADQITDKIDALIDNQSDRSVIDFLREAKIKLQNNEESEELEEPTRNYPAELFKSRLKKVVAPVRV